MEVLSLGNLADDGGCRTDWEYESDVNDIFDRLISIYHCKEENKRKEQS